MKNKILFLMLALVVIFSAANVLGLESYGTKKLNEKFTFCQVCADATYITLSSIETPTTTINLNVNMTAQGAGQFCYNYTPTESGRYDLRGISDGCEKTYATYVNITSSNTTFLLILLGLAIVFFIATWVVNEQFFIYIAGVLFVISGVYILINGVDFVNGWYSRALAYVCLGLGLLFSLGAYLYNAFSGGGINKGDDDDF